MSKTICRIYPHLKQNDKEEGNENENKTPLPGDRPWVTKGEAETENNLLLTKETHSREIGKHHKKMAILLEK